MKRTFTRTLFIQDLNEAKVTIEVFDREKWDEEANLIDEIKIQGIKSWSIYDKEDAEKLEKQMSLGIDSLHEYLEIEMLDGLKKYYKNSNVVLFVR